MKSILIFGAGGHAKVIVDIIEKQGKYNIAGFVDNYCSKNTVIMGYTVIGDDSSLKDIVSSYEICGGVIGIGDNSIRSRVRDQIIKAIPNFEFINCIHPKSILGKDVTLGDGNVVMAGAIINSSTKINNHCILNTNSSIDHDGLMSDFSSMAPNSTAGGSVIIGDYSAIGIGANIFDSIKIGCNCIVGGGSLVCNDTKDDSIYYGSPSKFIREHKIGDRYLNVRLQELVKKN
jgi:sugar O-acyltransferase (sialic acid O-acetyltransferase NeuD family)